MIIARNLGIRHSNWTDAPAPSHFIWQRGGERKTPAIIDLASACDVELDRICEGDAHPMLMRTLDWITNVFKPEQIQGILLGRQPLVPTPPVYYGHFSFHVEDYLTAVRFAVESYFGSGVFLIAPPPPRLPEGIHQSVYKYLSVLKHCSAIALNYADAVELDTTTTSVATDAAKVFALGRTRTDPQITGVKLVGFEY